MQDRLKKNPKIEFIFNSEVVEYIGTKRIEKVKVLNNKTKETCEMKMDGVFMAIGKKPTSDLFKDSKLELDKLLTDYEELIHNRMANLDFDYNSF